MERNEVCMVLKTAAKQLAADDPSGALVSLEMARDVMPSGDFRGSCLENAARSPFQAARFARNALREYKLELYEQRPWCAMARLERAKELLAFWT